MKSIRVLPIALRLVLAAQQPFNVHEDLFAFPQYEVIWQDDSPVSHEYAAEKLSLQRTRSSLTSEKAIAKHHGPNPVDSTPDGENAVASYENLMLGSQRYLCSLPVVPVAEPAIPSNRTADEEANDLALAVHRGEKLLQPMEGHCIYFISGWWSYSFCYNEGVRQFHPLPSGRNVPIYPPVEDKSVDAYILGRFHGEEKDDEDDMDFEESSGVDRSSLKKESSDETGLAKMEVKGHKGSTRYLTQVLKGGTICDLTGEARSIEIQFRCENMPTDRITVIKETSICQYRMVISTPRLCNDAAFRPPVGPKPHPISCSPVMPSESIGQYLEAREHAEAAKEADLKESADQAANEFFHDFKAAFGLDTVDANAVDGHAENLLNEENIGVLTRNIKKNLPRIGNIEIGGHNLVPEGTKLEKGAAVGGPGNEKFIATIARSDGFTMSVKELSKLNIRGVKELEIIKDKVSKTADGAEWQIDMVETTHGKELRAIIGDSSKAKKQKEKKAQPDDTRDDHDPDTDQDKSADGSEERYKEEL